MLRIHREGTGTLLIVLVFLLVVNLAACRFLDSAAAGIILATLSVAFLIFILSFFRKPVRSAAADSEWILSPCDGKVVVIEETFEPEYFRDQRLQVSIFMSPLNVHVNYYPVSGTVKYVQYHPGKHLVAWHPKSSTENERSTVVLHDGVQEILIRQIAGTVARRIVTYAIPGKQVYAGEEMGFIKFGSRVDLFLPSGTQVEAALNAVVTGAVTPITRRNS